MRIIRNKYYEKMKIKRYLSLNYIRNGIYAMNIYFLGTENKKVLLSDEFDF